MSQPSPGPRLEGRLPALIAAWRARQGTPRSPNISLPASQALSPGETKAAGRALLDLQRGLTGSRELPGSGYMEEKDLLGAYLLYYWPTSYLQVSLALAWLGRQAGGPLGLGRILDLGSGPGPATAALLDAGAREAVLLDSSSAALSLASELLAPAKVMTRVANLEAGLPPDLGAGFDLIIACHSLNELWKSSGEAQEKRLGLLKAASELLAPGGILLLVEPALLITSRDLLALRDGLLGPGSCLELLGPCTRQGPCPALAAGPGQTCHAEVAWDPPMPIAALAKEAGLDRSAIKTSWFAFARKNGDEARSSPGADPKKAFEALVVSEAMLNKAGRLRYLLCSEAGRLPLSARKDDAAARRQGFHNLGRYDLVRVRNPEARGDAQAPGWGLGEGSELTVLAKAPGLGGAFHAKG